MCFANEAAIVVATVACCAAMRRALSLLLMLCLGATAVAAADRSATAALEALIAEQWEWRLREFPEQATSRGDPRYADRWTDHSAARVAERRRVLASQLRRLDTIAAARLSEADRLNQALLRRDLTAWLESIDQAQWMMPVNQVTGVHLQPTYTASLVPLDTPRQVRNYTARLQALPALLDQLADAMRQGRARGLVPSRLVLDHVVAQCRALADTPSGDGVFAQRLRQLPPTIPASEREALRTAAVQAVDTQVRPAYRRFAEFIEREILPAARRDPGLWALPDGAARYRLAIRQQVTLDADPEQVHRTGLAEVARIEREQEAIARRAGYADLAALRQAVRTDRRFYAVSREQILQRYRQHTDDIRPKLPQLFGTLPTAPMEVVPVESFREKSSPGAAYASGTPDGSRPGRVIVNTGDPTQRLLLPMEAIAYHEGLPGHHLQAAIAQSLPALPEFRRQAHYGAYGEGWALYAERLAKEVGQYADPMSDYGRLSTEMLRAIRLVVDTGLHHRRWTREQVVAYFRAHSTEDEPTIQAETDRYIAWPAQALGYKLGELKILELRERARTRLGPRFDLRAFHDRVLGGGALPLDVLEARVDAWIARTAATP